MTNVRGAVAGFIASIGMNIDEAELCLWILHLRLGIGTDTLSKQLREHCESTEHLDHEWCFKSLKRLANCSCCCEVKEVVNEISAQKPSNKALGLWKYIATEVSA
jgi:hypothetical protein